MELFPHMGIQAHIRSLIAIPAGDPAHVVHSQTDTCILHPLINRVLECLAVPGQNSHLLSRHSVYFLSLDTCYPPPARFISSVEEFIPTTTSSPATTPPKVCSTGVRNVLSK